jgi:hypothetical protein
MSKFNGIVGILLISMGVSSLFAEATTRQPTVTAWGSFATDGVLRNITPGLGAQSSNGRFWCRYTVTDAGENTRVLANMEFYDGASLIYTMGHVPGSCVEISNNGFTVFYEHFEGNDSLVLHFYSKDGSAIMSQPYPVGHLFGFSEAGNVFGIGTVNRFELISLLDKSIQVYPSGQYFAISDDEKTLALAGYSKVYVYTNGKLVGSFDHAIPFLRGIQISSDGKHVGFIGRNELFTYELPSFTLKFSDTFEGNDGFCDIRLSSDKVWAGIRYFNDDMTESKGALRTYVMNSRAVSEQVQAIEQTPREKLNFTYSGNPGTDTTPWPVIPQNQSSFPWNSYVQLTSLGSPYLHQGLDLDIKPLQQNLATVKNGWVKAVLTKGGDIYWRMPIADVQDAPQSDAWMWAHVVSADINKFKVGQEVKPGVVIGGVVTWSDNLVNGGHLHYSRVRCKKESWSTWTSWANCLNPLLYFRPAIDVTPPKFLDFGAGQKFGFVSNDGDGAPKELDPQALVGKIDIQVHACDIFGSSPWEQAITYIWYTIKSSNGAVVVPKTLGFTRNLIMRDYDGTEYYSLPVVMYNLTKLPVLLTGSRKRNYIHIATNHISDSVVTTANKKYNIDVSFPTFNEGKYWIVVEIGDASGNTAVDSQEVFFKTGQSEINNQQTGVEPELLSFHSTGASNMVIQYRIPRSSATRLVIMDISGRLIKTLVSGDCTAGKHSIIWDGTTNAGQPAYHGMYLYRLQTGKYTVIRKMTLL